MFWGVYMIENPNNVNNTLELIAEKMDDFCVAHKKSNLHNIQIISDQIEEALNAAYQKTRQMRRLLCRLKNRLQKLIYAYLLHRKALIISGINSQSFFYRALLNQNLDIAKFKSTNGIYQTIRSSNNRVILLPKLQSINYLEA